MWRQRRIEVVRLPSQTVFMFCSETMKEVTRWPALFVDNCSLLDVWCWKNNHAWNSLLPKYPHITYYKSGSDLTLKLFRPAGTLLILTYWIVQLNKRLNGADIKLISLDIAYICKPGFAVSRNPINISKYNVLRHDQYICLPILSANIGLSQKMGIWVYVFGYALLLKLFIKAQKMLGSVI